MSFKDEERTWIGLQRCFCSFNTSIFAFLSEKNEINWGRGKNIKNNPPKSHLCFLNLYLIGPRKRKMRLVSVQTLFWFAIYVDF